MTADIPHPPPTPDEYDKQYYGVPGSTPKANYRNYTEQSQPHWAAPLAAWLVAHTRGPWLDLGAAYGHLVRSINKRAVAPLAANPQTGIFHPALAVEWSPYATARSVAGTALVRTDARLIAGTFRVGTFGTVVSCDFLEHFPPDETRAILAAIAAVAAPRSFQVHVIGAHNPDEPVARHMDDPTHRNHEPLSWYLRELARTGFAFREDLTRGIRAHPAWTRTDWRGRMIVVERMEADDGDEA